MKVISSWPGGCLPQLSLDIADLLIHQFQRPLYLHPLLQLLLVPAVVPNFPEFVFYLLLLD